jgi:hypothetical protein
VASPNRERERNMGSNKIKTNRAMAEMMNDMMSRVSRKYRERTVAAGKKCQRCKCGGTHALLK